VIAAIFHISRNHIGLWGHHAMVDMIAHLFEYEASPYRAKVGGWDLEWERESERAERARECDENLARSIE
jgi:hypothetical protein